MAKANAAAALSVKAYRGDAKTLLAFNLPSRQGAKDLAGFTIRVEPDGQPAYYLHNTFQFETPGDHAQDASEPPNSSLNAPLHKFRWLHVPGSVHQGTKPFLGSYKYTVTPRFFDNGSLQPLDPSLGVSVDVEVAPFEKGTLGLGFTRGFTQSQAFVNHFRLKALIRPNDHSLLFDTSQQSGKNAAGKAYTYLDEYEWLGFTARERIFGLLDEVASDSSLTVDVFAYDLNEPDLMAILVKLAKQGRIRIILDNAALHHSASKPAPEDQFEQLFTKSARKSAAIMRGHFGRYAHDKVFIVSKSGGSNKTPVKVLTGSTNFSVTGFYVNSNHVLVFDDAKVAAQYAEVFQAAWDDEVKAPAFSASALAGKTFSFSSKAVPPTDITFAPHQSAFADEILQGIADRIAAEGKKGTGGSVLFAVMQLDQGTGPIFPALRNLHGQQNIFSYGISDSPGGIYLYAPGKKSGVLVTGKPANTKLPPPFNQVPNIGGIKHQIHHKFVVCGFNGKDPVVYCGSSNLAQGGEIANGDNLLAIHDGDVATVFALEALALVDHFNFLDRYAAGAKKVTGKTPKTPPASPKQAALSTNQFLATTDKWVEPYFDKNDLHFVDRTLFGG